MTPPSLRQKIQASGGNVKNALWKIARAIHVHPWQAALVVAGSVAASVFICKYCGWLLSGGILVYIVRQKAD